MSTPSFMQYLLLFLYEDVGSWYSKFMTFRRIDSVEGFSLGLLCGMHSEPNHASGGVSKFNVSIEWLQLTHE